MFHKSNDGTVFLEYIPEFNHPSKRYQVVAKFDVSFLIDAESLRDLQKRCELSRCFLITGKRLTMHDLLRVDGKSEDGIIADFVGEYII